MAKTLRMTFVNEAGEPVLLKLQRPKRHSHWR